MSKWKNKPVKIVQIIADNTTVRYSLRGLGDDNMLYEWDYSTGRWFKYWNYINVEDGGE